MQTIPTLTPTADDIVAAEQARDAQRRVAALQALARTTTTTTTTETK